MHQRPSDFAAQNVEGKQFGPVPCARVTVTGRVTVGDKASGEGGWLACLSGAVMQSAGAYRDKQDLKKSAAANQNKLPSRSLLVAIFALSCGTPPGLCPSTHRVWNPGEGSFAR